MERFGILYVDDERVALEIFRHNFSDEFAVHTAQSVAEAKEVLANQDIALILSDQRMPGTTGTDFFAEIKDTHPEIVRILVTAYADLQAIVAAINAGHIYHYVEKPWDDEELRILIRRALEHVHLVRERNRLQEERIQTLEKMARSNRLAAVGTLAAGIAHEIRNPLSAILTFHQMLPEKIADLQRQLELLPTEQRGTLEHCLLDEFWTKFSKLPLREVERIRGLVQELLDFARDSSATLGFQRVNLKELVEEILPIVESDLCRVGIELKRDYDEGDIVIEASSDKIKQVLINLLLNAMHATHSGGEICMRLRKLENATCRLEVTDSGCGIAPENIERVFDPFFTTRDPGVGTGLGLTMCHHIIANHGGSIHLESEVGKGTRVWIDLPEAQTNVVRDVSANSTLGIGANL